MAVRKALFGMPTSVIGHMKTSLLDSAYGRTRHTAKHMQNAKTLHKALLGMLSNTCKMQEICIGRRLACCQAHVNSKECV